MTCQLYRHFDSSGVLLYVGQSISATKRFKSHKKTASWFLDIARVEIENFEDRQAALDAEREAIKSERPLFNVLGAVRFLRFNGSPNNPLVAYRRSNDLTQAQLAEKLDISTPMICLIENGERPVTPENARKWEPIMGVSRAILCPEVFA